MERDFQCINPRCRKVFTVKSDAIEPPDAQDVDVVVTCPYCEFQRPINWPRKHLFIVVPKVD